MEKSLPRPEIKAGRLVFVSLDAFEGELRVGLGRVVQQKGDDQTEIAWCERIGWSNDRTKKGFLWNNNPSFRAYRPKRRVVIDTHPNIDLLPVPVTLTTHSHHSPALSLADKKQKLRLEKPCVQLLYSFLRQHRPELRKAETVQRASVRKTSTALSRKV